MLQRRKRSDELITESDLSVYGADMILFLKARDAKKKAKISLRDAQTIYKKACDDLVAMRDNFAAAFESSEEPKIWTSYVALLVQKLKVYDIMNMIKFDWKSAFRRC